MNDIINTNQIISMIKLNNNFIVVLNKSNNVDIYKIEEIK